MVRPSRAWMRSSRSSNGQPNCRLKARPTLLLPAPMKPTRNTARNPEAGADGLASGCAPGLVLMHAALPERLLNPSRPDFSAFLEVDFTTEGKQVNRRCRFAHRTRKGTPCLDYERCVFGLQGEVVLHFTPYGARRDIDRGIRRGAGFNVAGVTGQRVFTARAEVALIAD